MDPRVVVARVAVDQRVDGAQLLSKLKDRVGLGAGRRVCTQRQSKVSRSAVFTDSRIFAAISSSPDG